jgi:hypothetical protein
MKKGISSFLTNFGFVRDVDIDPYSFSVSEYFSKDPERVRVHKEFLKSIEAEENGRLTLIESKSSQLVSQTGIIFSLLSLFIPVFIDKLSDHSLVIRLFFLIVVILAFLFYMLTIRNALKNFNVKSFVYSKPSPINVIKYQKAPVEEFTAIEVRDLLYGANQNLKTNNIKATNLIHAYNAFKVGNTLTALLVILICFSLLFTKSKKEPVAIKNPLEVKLLDSSIKVELRSIQGDREIPGKRPEVKADTAQCR